MLANPEKQTEVIHYEKSPSGFSIMWREFRKDKLAMFSLVFLAILLLAVYVTSFYYEARRYCTRRFVFYLRTSLC